MLGLSNSVFSQETSIYRDVQAAFKAGMNAYEQRLYGKAEDELGAAIKKYQNLFPVQQTPPIFIQEAELFAAIAAMRLERPDAEKRLLGLIQKHEPNALATRAKLEVGRYYYNKGEYAEVIQYLSKITWSDLGDMKNEEVIEAKFQLAYCYFVRKDFNKASPLFRQIKGNKTEYTYPANYYYGLCVFFQKNYDEALKSFNIAAKSNRYKKIVPTYITQIYFMKKDYDQTIRYGTPYANDNSMRDRMPIVQAVGQAHYEKGNYKKALPFIEEYVSKTPKVTGDLFYQLAYTKYRAGEYKSAIESFAEINQEKNKLGQNALYNQADCQLKLGQKSQARTSFKLASQMDYDKEVQVDAMMNYAKLSYELGLDNDAITAFMAVLDNPKGNKYSNEAQNLMSKVFLNTRDFDKALSILRPMDRRTPALKETYQKVCYFRGIQYFKSGDYANAIKLFNESLSNSVHSETSALSNYWKAESLFNLNQYDSSIDEYEKFLLEAPQAKQLPANSSQGTAYYGIGYSYLRKNDYLNAGAQFRKAIKRIQKEMRNINDQYVSKFVYPDAIIRAADCYLFQGGESNYRLATGYYQKVVDNNYPNQDYALYQLSLIYALRSKPEKQIQIADRLLASYPDSPFADDVLYAKGSTLIDEKDFLEAKKSFDRLIIKYPNSEFNASALFKLGVISYDNDQRLEALEYFKKVVAINIQTEEAKSSLSFIRRIYVEDGDPDGFMAYASTLQGYNFSDMAADSLLYEAAIQTFEREDYSAAVQNFSKYLDRFPKGLNSMSAHLNRGISYYNEKKYPQALNDFAYVSDAKSPAAPPAKAEQANLLAGKISYHITENYLDAQKYFTRLEQFASTADNRFEALLFGMRSAYFSKDYLAAKSLANKFLQEANATAQNKAEAYFYIAKGHFANKEYALARQKFDQSIKLVGDDIRASEARYQIARIWYIERKLEKAQEIAFQNNKELGQHLDWLARNFILISDIYAEQGNLDAAKGTLESLLSNYKGDPAIVQEAKDKLEKVKQAIASNSRLKRDEDSGELEMLDD